MDAWINYRVRLIFDFWRSHRARISGMTQDIVVKIFLVVDLMNNFA